MTRIQNHILDGNAAIILPSSHHIFGPIYGFVLPNEDSGALKYFVPITLILTSTEHIMITSLGHSHSAFLLHVQF